MMNIGTLQALNQIGLDMSALFEEQIKEENQIILFQMSVAIIFVTTFVTMVSSLTTMILLKQLVSIDMKCKQSRLGYAKMEEDRRSGFPSAQFDNDDDDDVQFFNHTSKFLAK